MSLFGNGDDKRVLIGILETLQQILIEIQAFRKPVTGKIVQLDKKGAPMATIIGVTAGGGQPHTFEMDALLNGVADAAGFPSGTSYSWVTDDQLISPGADSGPLGNQVVIPDPPASDTNSSFVLTGTIQEPTVGGVTPAPIVVTATIPIAPPLPAVANGGVINQLS